VTAASLRHTLLERHSTQLLLLLLLQQLGIPSSLQDVCGLAVSAPQDNLLLHGIIFGIPCNLISSVSDLLGPLYHNCISKEERKLSDAREPKIGFSQFLEQICRLRGMLCNFLIQYP
jgi:hypothetical protein